MTVRLLGGGKNPNKTTTNIPNSETLLIYFRSLGHFCSKMPPNPITGDFLTKTERFFDCLLYCLFSRVRYGKVRYDRYLL